MESGRRKVNDETILRADEAAVHERALDAVDAFADGGLREADEDGFGHRGGREIDLGDDGNGFDAEQGEGVEFGEHDTTHRAV